MHLHRFMGLSKYLRTNRGHDRKEIVKRAENLQVFCWGEPSYLQFRKCNSLSTNMSTYSITCVLFAEYFSDEQSLGLLNNSTYRQTYEHLKTKNFITSFRLFKTTHSTYGILLKKPFLKLLQQLRPKKLSRIHLEN